MELLKYCYANFYNLQIALYGAASEYLEQKKSGNDQSSSERSCLGMGITFLNRFLSVIKADKGVDKGYQRAENIVGLARILKARDLSAEASNRVDPIHVTEDEVALLMLASALLNSTSKKLVNLALPKLIELPNAFDGSLGGKAFHDGSIYGFQWPEFRNNHKFAVNYLVTADLQRIPGVGRVNHEAIDRMLTSAPLHSLKVELTLLRIWQLRKDSALATLPRDVLKIIMQHVHADLRVQIIQKIRQAAAE